MSINECSTKNTKNGLLGMDTIGILSCYTGVATDDLEKPYNTYACQGLCKNPQNPNKYPSQQ